MIEMIMMFLLFQVPPDGEWSIDERRLPMDALQMWNKTPYRRRSEVEEESPSTLFRKERRLPIDALQKGEEDFQGLHFYGFYFRRASASFSFIFFHLTRYFPHCLPQHFLSTRDELLVVTSLVYVFSSFGTGSAIGTSTRP